MQFFSEIKFMILFLLIIPRIYPILLATISLLIVTTPGCVSLHQQVWKRNDDERMPIKTVSKSQELNEELRQVNITHDSNQVMGND